MHVLNIALDKGVFQMILIYFKEYKRYYFEECKVQYYKQIKKCG